MFSKKVMKQIYLEDGPNPSFTHLFDRYLSSDEHLPRTKKNAPDPRVSELRFYDTPISGAPPNCKREKREVDYILYFTQDEDEPMHKIGSAWKETGLWYAEMGQTPVGIYDNPEDARRCIEVAFFG